MNRSRSPSSSSGAARLRRVAFSDFDADALVAFCLASGSPWDAALIRRLLLDMTSDAAGVIVLARDDAESAPALVATVIDRAENGAAAAILEILGVATTIPAPSLFSLVVEPAIAFARAGSRRALHVSLPESLGPIESAENVLRAAGFSSAYQSFTMCRPADAPPLAAPESLPVGWSWAALGAGRIAAAHAALTEIFRDAASFSISPLPDFHRAVMSGATDWRVILDGDTIAGLVQCAVHRVASGTDNARGELRTVARSPAYRGRGLGAQLVHAGLLHLLADGPRTIELSVEATNETALGLYRRFNFAVTARVQVLTFDLRRE